MGIPTIAPMPNWKLWGRRGLQVLRTWGLLAGLGLAPLPVALVAVASGFLASASPVVLGALLAVTLGWALVATAVAVLFYRRMITARRPFSNDPQPSQWLPKGDPRLLALTDRDIEDAFVRVRRYAQDQLGEDSEVWFESMGVLPGIELNFEAWSRTADKTMVIAIDGSGPRQPRLVVVSGGKVRRRKWPDDPFTADRTWRELLRKSWLREGPYFRGWLSLRPQDAYPVATENWNPPEWWYWLAAFSPSPSAPTMAIPKGSNYRLVDGQLTKL